MTKEQKLQKAIETLTEIATWGSDICNGWWASSQASKCLAQIKPKRKKTK